MGEPDHLQRLWTPYRMNYLAEAPMKGGSAASTQPFTDIPTLRDEDGLVVARGELVYVVLNLYPYNPGHLMVVPYRRVSELEDLTDAESAELMAFTQKAIRVIKSVSRPARVQRRPQPRQSAGGSLAEHLHMHVVPRWSGDANFITIIGGSKVDPAAAARDPRAAGHGMGETVVSDFYLMTRAAYDKLSTPVAKAALRAGFTPDSITIIGTAGAVHRRPDAFPIGQLWWGSFAVSFFVLADMLDGAMARERGGGTRFGAVLDATCDRIGDGAVFCGLLWWAAFGLHSTPLVVATDDLPGHLAGDLLRQGPRRGQRAER